MLRADVKEHSSFCILRKFIISLAVLPKSVYDIDIVCMQNREDKSTAPVEQSHFPSENEVDKSSPHQRIRILLRKTGRIVS